HLTKGYKIIDEYIKEEYIKDIADELDIKEKYVKNLYNNQQVMTRYITRIIENKEIDFDMILQYSQELIEQNIFIAQNISAIIRSIHVDEYQDTNEKQYVILSTLAKANKNINVLFVGDINQAIYRNLGGVAKSAKEIKTLFPISFIEECLDGCYRSTQRIVDYYVNYEVDKTGVYSVSEDKENRGIITLNTSINKDELCEAIVKIIKKEIDKGTPEEEICIVAPQWYQIYPMANKLRKLLPDNHFDAPDISPIKYDPFNLFFLIGKLLFTQQSGHRYLRKKEANEILNIIKEDYGFSVSETITKLDILKIINETNFITHNGISTLEKAIVNVLDFLKVKLEGDLEKSKMYFFEKIHSRVENYNLPYDCDAMERSFKEKEGIVINTIHGVKGEEYSTVIGFDLLNGHLPHWGYMYEEDLRPIRDEETNKLLYVLCSRAKENLYLFAEKGRTTRKGYPLSCTDELLTCDFEYD
ncbi:UvrD-helicase domain-containing protein, partial [Clostridium sporogenes]|uniref:UvrD-helicase domain-containing protein n=1 Tax=Clostridium sporogenes TaxID=1509 RepID=UPI00313C4CD3